MPTPPRCYFLDDAGVETFPRPGAITFTFPEDDPAPRLAGRTLRAGQVLVPEPGPVVEFRMEGEQYLPEPIWVRLDIRPGLFAAVGGDDAVDYARARAGYWWSSQATTFVGDTFPKRELLRRYGRFEWGEDGPGAWVIPAGTMVPLADFDAILAGDQVYIR